MPLEIVRNDIAKMHADAIVNAANSELSDGDGVCGALHRAAGPELLRECEALAPCETGQVKVTRGYALHCRYVIHAVGPVWQGGKAGEEKLLRSCYRNALMAALERDCRSIAFPLISSGIYGYPKQQALQVAVDEISAFLLQHDMQVYLVVFTRESVQISSRLFSDIRQYIDDYYVAARPEGRMPIGRMMRMAEICAPAAAPSLAEELSHLDESFSQMVLRRIMEKGITNAQCYKKANLDRKLFSKIQSDIHYKPKKQTALALAIALEMDLDETNELLMKAGLAISHSQMFDVIVEFFIKQGIYDIYVINEALFAYDQPLLGSVQA